MCTLTGGFVPERRELEYYLDVADAIREQYSTFYGVGIIGAPVDYSVLHKYKEAGLTIPQHGGVGPEYLRSDLPRQGKAQRRVAALGRLP